MKKHILYLAAICIILLNGCQKEKSFEAGNGPSSGSLQSDVSGDCLPKSVHGVYEATIALLADSNTVSVGVNVTTTGTYTIYSDTINGYYFRATGTFINTGANTVVLKGFGTPLAAGINNFIVSYDTTVCTFAVTVLPVGGGANGTLSGGPGACTSSLVNGSYVVGAALTAANTIQVQITAATAGVYSISTNALDGFSFSATGTAVTGVQLINLVGTGTPTALGDQTFTVSFGPSTCTFVVTVTNGVQAAYTLTGAPGACTPASIGGIFMPGTTLTTTDILQITVDVTTVGGYNITSDTLDGFSFGATGTFTATGVQTVNLIGVGAPVNTGPQAFTIKTGSSSCTYTVTVVPVDYFPRTTNSNWSYEFDNNANPQDSLFRVVIPQTLSAGANTYNIFMIDDGTGAGLDSSGYYRRSGGDYFEYLDIGYSIGFDPPPQWSEYIMLKDDVPAGTVWNSAAFTGIVTFPPPGPPPTSFTVRFKYSIFQKDVPVTVVTSLGSTTYQNVIVVKEEYQQFDGLNWNDITTTIGYGQSYYARGVGLIKYEAYDGTGTLLGAEKLRRHQIF